MYVLVDRPCEIRTGFVPKVMAVDLEESSCGVVVSTGGSGA